MNRRHFTRSLTVVTGALLSNSTSILARQGVPAGFRELGVQEDGRWISPQFGVEIQWEKPYELDYTPGGSIFSDEYGDTFNISLPNTNALFNANISGPANSFHVPFADQEEFIGNYEETHEPIFLLFTASEDIVGALLVIEWGESVYSGDDIPNQVFLLQSYTAENDPSVVISTRIDARYDSIEDYVKALDEHVTVDGGPALRAFTVDEVLEALEDLPADG